MNRIEYLLKKYEQPTSGERYSNEYKKKLRMEERVKYRHLLLEELIKEVPFHVTAHEKSRVCYLIDNFPNIKNLHHTAKTEAVLLAYIFLLKTLKHPKTDIEEFYICEKYGLTNRMFTLIICRLFDELSQKIPLPHNSAAMW